MTTAAQYLVALSGLSGVSAGEHLMAITAGTGATIFATQMSVISEVQQITVYRKPKRTSQEVEPKPSVQSEKGSKNLFLKADRNEQTVFTEPEQVWATEHPKQSTSFTKPHNVFTIRRKTVN